MFASNISYVSGSFVCFFISVPVANYQFEIYSWNKSAGSYFTSSNWKEREKTHERSERLISLQHHQKYTEGSVKREHTGIERKQHQYWLWIFAQRHKNVCSIDANVCSNTNWQTKLVHQSWNNINNERSFICVFVFLHFSVVSLFFCYSGVSFLVVLSVQILYFTHKPGSYTIYFRLLFCESLHPISQCSKKRSNNCSLCAHFLPFCTHVTLHPSCIDRVREKTKKRWQI